MNTNTNTECKGQLALRYVPAKRHFEYILVHHPFPKYEQEVVVVEDGDTLTVRHPSNGSVMFSKVIDLDYNSGKSLVVELGEDKQMVAGQPLNGIQRDMDPNFWFSLFSNGYYADLTKSVK